QARPGTCDPITDRAFTGWDHLAVTYTNGKVIDTITSHHYGGADPATAGASEKFYFTKIYGLTRWESWVQDPTAAPIWDASCNGAKRVNGWTMRDCRDWTNVVAVPGGNDMRYWPVPQPRVSTLTFESESPEMRHIIGSADADGWSAATASWQPNFLQFGPYTTAIPKGQRVASFTM